MIDSILLVDDENLFHLVFEDVCSILDFDLELQIVQSTDKAENLFKKWQAEPDKKPRCMFVDLNVLGSSFDGIELIRKLNQDYGNGVVVGIISSSADHVEQQRAREVGAQFWIVKDERIEPLLEDFKKDFPAYKDKSAPFKVYEN